MTTRSTTAAPEQYLQQAQQLITSGRYAEAETSLRRLLARRAEHTEARILLSMLGRDRQDWPLVAAALSSVPDADPRASALRVAEGDAWLRLHRAARAENCWNRALQLDPELQIARHRLLYLYGMQLRREAWTKLLWELYDRGQAGFREMLLLMIAGQVVWETDQAIETVHPWTAADPADLHSQRALGIYLVRAGRTTQAIAQLTPIWQEHSEDAESYLALIDCYRAEGDAAKMLELLARCPSTAQSDGRYWKQRGAVALLDGRYDDAVSDFEQALGHARYDGDLHHKLSQALRFTDQAAEAEQHARIASLLARIERLCHSLHNASSWNAEEVRQLVSHCEELGLIEEARGWVAVGIARDPQDPWLRGARDRLAQMPATSSRRPPPVGELM
ncbi:MAG: tetratricopeptide repeat protein [Planctomycetes bacterium]|nr:tetratricopeptide repeat protein [Planctomycetota bacterium]